MKKKYNNYNKDIQGISGVVCTIISRIYDHLPSKMKREKTKIMHVFFFIAIHIYILF